jgi:DNA-binding transcriptional LysR family regulator
MRKIRSHQRTDGLSWEDLRTILAIARCGSLSGAARMLEIEHSTVFRRLDDIEKRLGNALFDRSRTGYTPNPRGDLVVEAAEAMELAAQNAARRLQGFDGSLTGCVRVATSELLGWHLMPRLLKGFMEAHPQIEVVVDVSRQLADLGRGEADIALRITASPPDDLVGRKLVDVAVAAYVHRELADRQASGTLGTELPWIGAIDDDPGRPMAQWLRAVAPEAKPSLRTGSVLSMMESAAQGLGAAVLPCFAAVHHRDLVRISEPKRDHGVGLWLLFHPDMRPNTRVRTLSGYMVEHVPELLQNLSCSEVHAFEEQTQAAPAPGDATAP